MPEPMTFTQWARRFARPFMGTWFCNCDGRDEDCEFCRGLGYFEEREIVAMYKGQKAQDLANLRKFTGEH